MAALRARGRYGPRLRDALPGMTLLVGAVCALVAAHALLYRAHGARGPVLALTVLAVTGTAVWCLRRPAARRRRGYYTPEEISALDTPGLVPVVARLLRRDGWYVRPSPERGRPSLCAHDAAGRHLDVAFRPVAEPLPDEEPHAASADVRRLRVVVHRGSFTARDAQWARRQGDVVLVDGARLLRWATGTPLHSLDDTD